MCFVLWIIVMFLPPFLCFHNECKQSKRIHQFFINTPWINPKSSSIHLLEFFSLGRKGWRKRRRKVLLYTNTADESLLRSLELVGEELTDLCRHVLFAGANRQTEHLEGKRIGVKKRHWSQGGSKLFKSVWVPNFNSYFVC